MRLQMNMLVLALAAFAVGGCSSEAPDKAPADTLAQAQTTSTPTPVQVVAAPKTQTSEASDAPQPAATPVPPTPPVPAEAATEIPDVVARVGEQEITGEDFQRQLNYAMQMAQSRGMPGMTPPPSHEHIVRGMVDSEILTIMALKEGVPITDEEVQAKLDERKAAMPEGYYPQWLESQGLTEESLRELLQKTMATESFVESKTKHLEPTEEDIVAEYEKLKAAGHLTTKQDSTDVAHILIKAEGEDEAVWAAAKERIDTARARIVAGEVFGDVAGEVSEDPGSKSRGGAYPGTPSGKMVPEFDQRMATIPIGEVTEPFRTDFGWHILTVSARKKAGEILPMEDIREGLTRSVMVPRQRELIVELVEEAKKSLEVEILYPVLTEEALTAAATEDAPAAQDAAPTEDAATPEAQAAPVVEEAPAADAEAGSDAK